MSLRGVVSPNSVFSPWITDPIFTKKGMLEIPGILAG